jgi:hypothetical protein
MNHRLCAIFIRAALAGLWTQSNLVALAVQPSLFGWIKAQIGYT